MIARRGIVGETGPAWQAAADAGFPALGILAFRIVTHFVLRACNLLADATRRSETR